MDKMTTALVMDQMPRTFTDAIVICRKLEIPFLWIDALCIVQNDAADWQRESAMMDKIYSNAYITLAASEAIDSNGGLLGSFVPAAQGIDPDWKCIAVRIACRHSRSGESPLAKRGWTLQEASLSRRILYFTGRQLRWQCLATRQYEDELLNKAEDSESDFPLLLRSLELPEQAPLSRWYDEWQTISEAYSKRDYTRFSDRFPALAGITSYFQNILQDQPFAGLWRNALVSGLLWQPHDRTSTLQVDGVPSWSWLAVMGEIEYNKLWTTFRENSETTIPQLSLITASVVWAGVPLTSDLTSASLTVRGRLLKVQVIENDMTGNLITIKPDGGAAPTKIAPDTVTYSTPHELFCLQIAIVQVKYDEDFDVKLRAGVEYNEDFPNGEGYRIVLLLARTGAGVDEYRRLGIRALRNRAEEQVICDRLYASPERTVTLVLLLDDSVC